jgi:DNA polymerase-3 subunit beta
VPARLLSDFVNSLPDDKIELSLSRQTLSLSCARYSAHINGVDAGDFPPIPQVAEGVSTTIDPEVLRQGVTMVAFAAATEDTRPVLTGVNVEMEEDRLALVAADGFRLALLHLSLLSPVPERTVVIVPGRALSELARLLPEGKGEAGEDSKKPVEVTLNTQRGQALFRLSSTEMVTQLIQGTFPNYSQLIPTGHETRTVVATADFLRAARIASLFARDGSGIVRVVITPGADMAPGKMTVSARSEEIADNMGEIDAVVEGGEAKIAFNGRYLTEVLAVLKEEKVAVETTSPSSPGVLRPAGNDNYTHVVMPMFVQW